MTTTRKSKTAADIKAELTKLQQKLIELEQKENEQQLNEAIKKHAFVALFGEIQAETNVTNKLTILAAIGKAVGIPRLLITQTEVKTRKKQS